ncbi:MAG: NYN domain-containing protein [Gemmatimonadaceae bacterium]|nr:NYN domain-containing protein [Gemmatimonadaceae bacterium]
MQSRSTRHGAPRSPIAPLHRGPQAMTAGYGAPTQHAPNAALLIDFDNVTMGIRSDLAGELRNLLGSEIIKGKVAVQRAYADWRRYPQYIVPLAESSIDMIMAPAYGSSKKNATDIRLAVDAIELVFTRPEIGTYILLSGDSDFASLVTKLKEYGKYVIGVGIRESSSDLLVMNCDEYYSYNALAGLVKQSDEEVVKWDPWELVVEAIGRMQKNGDVMRSDRLKQVMQDIDASFDEKSVGHGYSKFSRFVQDASEKGLVKITKLENGQLEVSPSEGKGATTPAAPADASRPAASANGESSREERRDRRGRRGRGRDRDRDRDRPGASAERAAPPTGESTSAAQPAPNPPAAPSAAPAPAPSRSESRDAIGRSGERLTRQEAFDLVRSAAGALVSGDDAALSSDVRQKAFALLGRDSESLGERNFHRILRDAHDAEVIDLRRRGDDYEVSLPAKAASVADQVKAAEAAATPARPAPTSPSTPRGMGPRGIPARRGAAGPPPDLLLVGVVEAPPAPAPDVSSAPAAAKPATKKAKALPKTKAVRKDAKPTEAPKAEKKPPKARPRAAKKAAAGA